MSVVFKKFFATTVSDRSPAADLRRITIETDPVSDRATRLRSIAQEVLSSVRSAKCIAVISAGSQNTSWLLANLAYALAETQHSVCLVEADLRKPRLSSVFDLPSSVVGLAGVLEGNIRFDEAKYEINPYLTIVPGGDYRGDVIGLIASLKLGEALAISSETYSLTLVLCPPSADYSDYSFICRFCDGVIIVAQKDKCRMADVVGVRDQLDKLGVPLVYALLAGGSK